MHDDGVIVSVPYLPVDLSVDSSPVLVVPPPPVQPPQSATPKEYERTLIKEELMDALEEHGVSISEATIGRYQKMGMPYTKASVSGQNNHYSVDEVLAWMESAGKTGKIGAEENPDNVDWKKWRAVKERLNAKLLQIDLDEREGLMVRKSDVEAASIKKIQEVKSGLLNLPAYITPLLVGRSAGEIEAELTRQVEHLLNQFSKL